jgi:hypothetical protein
MFFLLDAAIGYRIPKRYGILSLEARNILDEGFQFQDDEFRTRGARRSAFVPERALLARATFFF